MARSTVSLSFSPRLENTLMPLSSYGLCDAEITTPKSYPRDAVRYAIAGVGMTPALSVLPPSYAAPSDSARSIQAPDSRVSRPMRMRGRGALRSIPRGIVRTMAAPNRVTVGMSRG
jgi:hypothetical protein